MPNQNPIRLDSPGEETIYEIDQKYARIMIYLTIKVELLGEGWQYASAHSIFFAGKDIFPSKTPKPEDLKIDYAELIDKKKLSIRSHVSRFRNVGEETPPKVKYVLMIEAGDKLLDEFSMESDNNNPSDFNSILRFKLNT